MRCFIHTENEAIAACRQCGKGMCEDCSAYSGHQGICPECRLNDFKKERNAKKNEVCKLTSEIRWGIFKTVLVFWTVIGLGIGIYNYYNRKNRRNELSERISVLEKEISKLESVLKHRGGAAFV